MTRVVISQPMYFPWFGFMAQMSLADVFIWLDDAQFSKGSFTNRVQVKTDNGLTWMSVPLKKERKGLQIKDLVPAHQNWQMSQNMMLSQSFKEYRYCNDILEMHMSITMGKSLIDTLIESVERPARAMGILPKNIFRSSKMKIDGCSWQRVLRLVQEVGGTEYITGHGAISYLDHSMFEKVGIDVSYMNYKAIPWPQPHGGFIPNVTILDLLAAVSDETARKHLNPTTLNWREFKKSP